MSARVRSTLIHYGQGLLMGAADIIPGVSGGTMALIVGIYERLIFSVRAVASAVVAVLRGHIADARANLEEVYWSLVLPLAAGVLTALLIGARIIPGILEAYPVQSRAVFFGLIAGSLIIPWRRIQERSNRDFVVAAIGAVVAFLIVGIPPRDVGNPAMIGVFIAASIAICAMILPGVSGSFLLLVMGMYEPTLRAVSDRNLLYIGVFVLGAAVGLGMFSKLLDYLLRHYHDLTMAALVGLMAGSLRALWPYLDADRRLLAPPADPSVWWTFALALLGFLFVTLLARFAAAADQRVEAKH